MLSTESVLIGILYLGVSAFLESLFSLKYGREHSENFDFQAAELFIEGHTLITNVTFKMTLSSFTYVKS